MSIDQSSAPMAPFMTLSQRLSEIFETTSQRLSKLSDSLLFQPLTHSQTAPDQPNNFPRLIGDDSTTSGTLLSTLNEKIPEPAIASIELSLSQPQTALPPGSTLELISSDNVRDLPLEPKDQIINPSPIASESGHQSSLIKVENHVSPHPPSLVASEILTNGLKPADPNRPDRSPSGDNLRPVATTSTVNLNQKECSLPREEDKTKPDHYNLRPSPAPDATLNDEEHLRRNGQKNLLERIASPTSAGASKNEEVNAQAHPVAIHYLSSRSHSSSPMDLRQSSGESSRPDMRTNNQRKRKRSPSPSSVSSFARRSTSPSSDSRRSRAESRPTRGSTRNQSPRHSDRADCRSMDSRPGEKRAHHRTCYQYESYRPSRSRSRSQYQRPHTFRTSIDPKRDSADPNVFLARAGVREGHNFKGYLEDTGGQSPSYGRLISILRGLQSPDFREPTLSAELVREFRRFQNRAETSEERMLRHLAHCPHLMHPYLELAHRRRVVHYRPCRENLRRSTVLLDPNWRPPRLSSIGSRR